jgi:hypothetical protein
MGFDLCWYVYYDCKQIPVGRDIGPNPFRGNKHMVYHFLQCAYGTLRLTIGLWIVRSRQIQYNTEAFCTNTKANSVNDSIKWSSRLYIRRIKEVYGGEPVP